MRAKTKTTPPVRKEVLDYLEGKLTDDERYAVEQRWLRDPDTRAAIEGLEQSGLSGKELKNDLSEIRQAWQKRDGRPIPIKASSWSWVLAAGFLLLMFWSAWGYYKDQRPAQVYADYFAASTAQEDYLVVRGGAARDVPGLNTALAAYGRKDYRKSYNQFQNLREDYPFNSMILRYTALAAMQVGEFYAAEQVLQQNLSITATVEERAAAKWYLALVYLRLEEKAAAKALLAELAVAGQAPYAAQARKLLEEKELG